MNASRRFRVSCVWAMSTVVLALLVSSQAPGQGKKNRDSELSPGDRVEVRQGNEWQVGEVLETIRGGRVKVQLAGASSSRVVTVSKQLVRRAEAAASTAATNASAASRTSPVLRVWTDSTGQRKVEAEFVKVVDGKVTFRKKDGSLAVSPLERLSKQDQSFIASLADNTSGVSPEDVLRKFIVSLAGGNRKQAATLIVPHPDAAILFQGESAPPAIVAQIEEQLASAEIRRLKPGDEVALTGGQAVTVGADDVSANRVLLQVPNHPIPYTVVRNKDGWQVDATPIIQARQAAFAMRDGAGEAQPDSDDVGSAAEVPSDWQTITALEGRVSIQLPGKPISAEQVSQIEEGPVTFVVNKYSSRGRFWNFQVVTYPAALIEAVPDRIEFLQQIGAGTMRGKVGSEQISAKTMKDSAYPAVRLEYRYPPGKNSAGQYGGGQAFHELYLIGNQLCWAYVDVLDVAREVENGKVTAELKHFFASLVIPKG